MITAMSTQKVERLECHCENDECLHTWTTRKSEIPYQCPRCLKRKHIWNRSEENNDKRKND